MLNFSGSLKVFVAIEACDMRRSFNGLHDAVSHRPPRRKDSNQRPAPLALKSSAAGQSAAVLYTIMTNCRRLGIDPREYLVDVLTRLPAMQASAAAALTPTAWQAARQGKALRKVA